jgi:hypothetical protein
MNKFKWLAALLCLALAFAMVPASSAQSIPVVAAGSTGFFAAAGLAASTNDPIRSTGPLCGSRFWTSGSGGAVDARTTLTSPNLPHESANIWIAWDNDTTPTVICAYLAVDSTIGQRLFFGQGSSGNATLLLPTNSCSTPGANKIAFVWDTATSGLPIAVYNALMGTTGTTCPGAAPVTPVHFNVAFSDIRAEDSQYLVAQRALCNDANSTAFFPPDDKSCLGFGPGVTAPGTAVVSSYSTKTANAAAYAFTGTDPISGISVPASQQLRIGLQAALVFVNIANAGAGSGGFGEMVGSGYLPHPLTTVSSHTLSALYTGQAFFTRDVYGGPAGAIPQVFAHTLVREPFSGTYNVFESQVIRQRDGFNANSQETGICGPSQSCYTSTCFVQSATAYPTTACSNPMDYCIGSNCSLKTRVIGTGEMISVGNTSSLPDSLGYAFWSLGNFGNKLNMRYLALDGVDGLYPSYSVHNGVFPGGVAGQGTAAILIAPTPGQCGGYFNGDGGATITNFSCNSYTLPTFDGIQNGSYRLWNMVQAQYYGSSALAPTFSPINITGFILGAQDQAAGSTPRLNDFVPYVYCANAACSSIAASPVQVFRSHYGLGGVAPNNGIVTPSAEAGGDMSGAVFNTQSELDANLTGGSFLVWIQ